MRSGDVYTDAATQSRLMPMPRLRPTMWAHARPGVVRTDGSGNISSIVTGSPINLTQGNSSLRPSVGNVLGRSTLRFATPGTQRVLESDANMFEPATYSMACLWWQRSGDVAALSVLDIFMVTFGKIRSTITPDAVAEVAFTTNTIGIANDTAVLATLVYDGASGVFRVGANSLTITDSFTPEDATIQLTSTGGCDYFECAVFNRALSASETRILEGIMAWSNGFPQTLGAGHPFLTRPPMLGD